MPKEAVVPELAAWFQEKGVNALIFDTRGIGDSDGEPRCDVSLPYGRVDCGFTEFALIQFVIRPIPKQGLKTSMMQSHFFRVILSLIRPRSLCGVYASMVTSPSLPGLLSKYSTHNIISFMPTPKDPTYSSIA